MYYFNPGDYLIEVTAWVKIVHNFLITRDQAEYCCAKYGMSLMSVDTVAEQTFVTTAFLPVTG
jgi:hypothetical protein